MNNTLETSGTLRTKKDLHVIGILVAGVLLCAFAALIAFPQLTESLRIAQSARALSKALPGALYVSDTQYVSSLNTASATGFTPVSFSGLLISARHTSHGLLSVVRGDTGVYEIRLDNRILVQSTFAVASADMSPDGTYVVYSIQTQATKPLKIVGGTVQFVTLNTSEWTVVAHDVKNGKNIFLGAGLHPFFADNSHVIKIAPAGIYTVDISTLAATELTATHTPFVFMAPLISPDHSYVGIARADTKSVDIYHVNQGRADHVVTLGLVRNASSYILGNTGMYYVRGDMMGPLVTMTPYDAPDTVRVLGSLPKEMNIGRIIP